MRGTQAPCAALHSAVVYFCRSGETKRHSVCSLVQYKQENDLI